MSNPFIEEFTFNKIFHRRSESLSLIVTGFSSLQSISFSLILNLYRLLVSTVLAVMREFEIHD